jgi:hypothetical protein
LPQTRLWASFGQFAQFPSFDQFYGPFGSPALRAERANFTQVGIEHRLTANFRFRAEAYNRQERDIVFSPDAEFRLVDGTPRAPTYGPVLANSLRGYSRGIELTLQRRSANRVSGWLTYSRGFTRYRHEQTATDFWGDFDQRHTFAAFAMARIKPTVSLSGSARYGSGFPVCGYLTRPVGYTEPNGVTWRVYVLSDLRNQERMPAYGRVDLRINKDIHRDRWKLTLFGELDNALRRDNYRFYGFSPSGYRQGWVTIIRDTMMPFLPTGGMAIEF